MKNNYRKLLALLLSGCITFSGCGAAGTQGQEDAAGNTEAQENTENGENTPEDGAGTEQGASGTETDGNGGADALPGSGTDGTDGTVSATGSSVSNTTFPSANTEPEIPAPLTSPDNQSEIDVAGGERHTMVGIITDATKYSVSVQTPDGNRYDMSIPESGVDGNLNYITIGQLATLSYVGSLDESHAALVGISGSSMITGIYVEEYAFAIKIINAARAMDLKELSDLTNFPVFLETGEFSSSINTSGEFEAIDNEKIFTEALVSRLANYNLFDLQYTDAGFVMGVGTPSLTFDVDDDGILGIIGINCNPAPSSSDN